MTALPEEKVLRINCPGFGITSTLPLGEAKPLAMYDVIVINPISAMHLFDNKSDQLKQIEVLQSDGMTSFRAEDDSMIESIVAELDIRAQELHQFLKKGGLLVYFLTPPFVVQGPNQSMDNYSWLNDWSPDKPSGTAVRNMSATIRGKAIETSVEAEKSVWMPYLKQAGLEWSTIIRLENLTEGYVPLATAGPNKCIAGFKSSGPKAGQIVFLPAPYSVEFDVKLKECLDRWFALHNDDGSVSSGLQDLSKGLSSLLSEEPAAAATPRVDVPPMPANVAAKLPEAQPQAAPVPATAPAPAPAPQPAPVAEAPVAKAANTNGAQAAQNGNDGASGSDAGDLIRKMSQEISKNVPDWCAKFSFEELDGLRDQLSEVEEEIRAAQTKAQELQTRIHNMDDLKNSLLSAQGESLLHACTRVFERLGWQVKPAMGAQDELWLIEDDKTQAIVRVVFCPAQPQRAELAALAESVITYWGAHEIEPKGILVASTWADKPVPDRPDEDYQDSMSDFAKRKNLCLLTTSQLLSIYRDLDISEPLPKTIRENLLTTSGRVMDYIFNKKGSAAATQQTKAK